MHICTACCAPVHAVEQRTQQHMYSSPRRYYSTAAAVPHANAAAPRQHSSASAGSKCTTAQQRACADQQNTCRAHRSTLTAQQLQRNIAPADLEQYSSTAQRAALALAKQQSRTCTAERQFNSHRCIRCNSSWYRRRSYFRLHI